MILVDSSVWIDHLRTDDATLAKMLDGGRVLAHPFIIGELALGRFRQRDLVMGALLVLPQAVVASDEEVLDFIDRYALFGSGIGYIDAHLLAAARLTTGTALWTRDERLRDAAKRLGVDAGQDH